MIQDTTKKLADSKNQIERMRLSLELTSLRDSVAIRVKTKKQADSIWEALKDEINFFPYPFGDYLTWIEIDTPQEPVSYSLLPPDETWPHWQIYLGPTAGEARQCFLWSQDGRIGPHLDRPGGKPTLPTLFVYQDGEWCAGCEYFEAVSNDDTIHKMVCVNETLPPALKAQATALCCSFKGAPDIERCPHSQTFWDAALLPISIIMYIAVAPTQELDKSWHSKRTLGKGKSERSKVGHYLITPIKKTYIRYRIEKFKTGKARELEIPSFVRGHHRRGHQRFLSWLGISIDVKPSWVRPFWRGPEWADLPPHYSLKLGQDKRVDAARELLEEKHIRGNKK